MDKVREIMEETVLTRVSMLEDCVDLFKERLSKESLSEYETEDIQVFLNYLDRVTTAATILVFRLK